ncbi:MAG: MMPL family transporter [Pseudomonadales bacterium]|nr:MMPL family transporter [Pseudomonadales bacterium]
MIIRLYLFCMQYRLPVLALVTLITLVAASGMSRLTLDTSFNSLIPPEEPEKLVYQKVVDEFGSDNKTIVYVRDSDLWSVYKLRALDTLERDLRRVRNVVRVDSLFSLRTIEGRRNGPDEPYAVASMSVIDQLPQTQLEVEEAKERALQNPLYIGNLFSENGLVTAMIVTVEDPDDEVDFSLEIFRELSEVLARHEADFELLFQVGPPRINAELQESLAEDFRLLGPLSAFVLIAAILVFMRSVLAAAIPLVTSAITIVWTFGLMGFLGIPVNILSAMIPSLIIVIGSTEDTHMMSAFFRGLGNEAETGKGLSAGNREAAVAYMARHTGIPMLLTVVTTALGFGSNIFGSIALIQDFAIASTLAVMINGLITVMVVPGLLIQFSPGIRRLQDAEAAKQLYTHNFPEKVISTFRISQDNFPVYTLVVTFCLCVFFTYHAAGLYVTNDPMSYFQQDRPLVRDTARIHQDLAGTKVFYVSLSSERDRAFTEPENLKKLDEIQQFLRKQGVYDLSLSVADHLKYVNREFQGRFAELSLPSTRQLAAQYLLFFHRSELEDYISHDFRRANIVVRHNVNDSHDLNRYITELKAAASRIAGPGLTVSVIGENLLVNQAAESLMLSQVEALGLLLALIFIVMAIMFTSLKGGAIALIPSVIPIVIMFGIMGLLGIPLNPGTAMVAVIAVGIAIDGTIHLLARYNELCRQTSDYEAAVHQAVKEVATPLIVSSIALAFGFGILLFSNFTVVAQFGALAAATMLISIFSNLLITPIIMARIRLVGLYQIISMNVDTEVLESSPLFAGMSNYQRRKAILISELHEFGAGENLVTQGTTGRSMFMILSGKAEVVRRDQGEDGESARVLAVLGPGQIFGEVGYIRAAERTADVTASEPVSALRFDYERMEKDLKYFPHIVARLNANISTVLGERLASVLAENSLK